MPGPVVGVEQLAADRTRLAGFRLALHAVFGRRADALFELVEAVLTASGPVRSLVELSLEKAFRRGHGALFDALAHGVVDPAAFGALLAGSLTPPGRGPVTVAVDVSAWPRPHAATSAERGMCHAPCRCTGTRKAVAGWDYSFAAALEPGSSSWTALLDAVRITPRQDAVEVTVEQVARVVAALERAGHLRGRPTALAVFDAGYNLPRLSFRLGGDGVPVQVLGRLRGNRVFRADPVQRPRRLGGRPRRHGEVFKCADPATHPVPDQERTASGRLYGRVRVSAWHRLHPELERDRAWRGHAGRLPIVVGTVIRVEVERLPGRRAPQVLWLWHTAPEGVPFDLDVLWRAYLRRFDIEHTFRFLKQVLGWTAPQVRTPGQGDRWTRLIVAAHAQLRLARTLVEQVRRRWERPVAPGGRLSPGRVRRGFPRLVRELGTPATRAKPCRPGPGRPPGTARPPRQRYPVVMRPQSERDRKRT